MVRESPENPCYRHDVMMMMIYIHISLYISTPLFTHTHTHTHTHTYIYIYMFVLSIEMTSYLSIFHICSYLSFFHIYVGVIVYLHIYIWTGQFFRGIEPVWNQIFLFPRLVTIPRLKSPVSPTAMSRIRTWFAVSISYDDNHYNISTSLSLYIYIYIWGGSNLSFKHIWLSYKNTFCLYDFIRIL